MVGRIDGLVVKLSWVGVCNPVVSRPTYRDISLLEKDGRTYPMIGLVGCSTFTVQLISSHEQGHVELSCSCCILLIRLKCFDAALWFSDFQNCLLKLRVSGSIAFICHRLMGNINAHSFSALSGHSSFLVTVLARLVLFVAAVLGDLACENYAIEHSLWASGAHSTWPSFFLLATAPARSHSIACLLSFPPPTTPTELM